MSSPDSSDSSFFSSFLAASLGAAAAPPAAGDAAAGAAPPPPDGIDASFSLPLAMTPSTDFPLSSLITFLTRSASLSMPTLPSIFSTSAADGSLFPPIAARR
uniref:Putative secreted protein n=1 Tax=Ixodes ricinus TaxID=34613 RepID=A0A6B0U9F4_IXORI